MTHENPSAVFTRRHDLDWLRIIAFGLLIFYHIGMFFNSEAWHAKSLHANAAIEPVMWLSSPWRLPLLFFISGVAIRFLGDKLGSAAFARDRTLRLLPVIVFGMLVIVPPQTYAELVAGGLYEGGFWGFYARYAGEWAGPWEVHTPTWNHLWYVVYLLVYSLLLAPLFPVLRRLADSPALQAFGHWAARHVAGLTALLVLPVLVLVAYRLWLVPQFPTTHALLDDWANHAASLTFVLLGFMAAKNAGFWAALRRWLPVLGLLALAVLAGLFWAYTHLESLEGPVALWIARLARVAQPWLMILALSALAQRFLFRDGPARRYLTEAIFPYYILHQTIIVVTGFLIRDSGLDVWTEFLIILAMTLGGCVIGYELIRRMPVLRPVFGLKLTRSLPPVAQPDG